MSSSCYCCSVTDQLTLTHASAGQDLCCLQFSACLKLKALLYHLSISILIPTKLNYVDFSGTITSCHCFDIIRSLPPVS